MQMLFAAVLTIDKSNINHGILLNLIKEPGFAVHFLQ